MVKDRYLLDTYIFIWWMENNKRLPKQIGTLLTNPDNFIFVSVVSVWEIVIKKAKKKLKVPSNIEEGIVSSGFRALPINISHVLGVEKLPRYHNDPFDRILIAQAKEEGCRLITNDPMIKKYNVSVVG